MSVAYAGATLLSPSNRMAPVRRVIFALASAIALNCLILLGLVIDHESTKVEEFSAEAIHFSLVPAFRKIQLEKPHVRQRPPLAPPQEITTGVVAPAPIPRVSTAPAPDTVAAEPFDPAKLRSALRSHTGCLSASHLTTEERDKCAEFLGSARDKIAMLPLVVGKKQAAFDGDAESKEAVNAYKRSGSNRDFPGLGAVFAGRKPLPLLDEVDPMDVITQKR